MREMNAQKKMSGIPMQATAKADFFMGVYPIVGGNIKVGNVPLTEKRTQLLPMTMESFTGSSIAEDQRFQARLHIDPIPRDFIRAVAAHRAGRDDHLDLAGIYPAHPCGPDVVLEYDNPLLHIVDKKMERGIGIPGRFLLLFPDDDEMAVGIGRSLIGRAVFFGGDGSEPSTAGGAFILGGRASAKQQEKQQEWDCHFSLESHAVLDTRSFKRASS